MAWSTRERVYAVALTVGVLAPLTVLAPWIADHGLNVSLLVRELFATGGSAFFAVDVIIAVLVLFTAAALDDGLTRASRITVGVASLLGASAGLPAYLLIKERAERRAGSKGSNID